MGGDELTSISEVTTGPMLRVEPLAPAAA